jgi:hypothetical protein
MHAARHGHTWIGDASPDREPFAHARNHVVKSVLEAQDENPGDYDGASILWSDSDMVWDVHGITQLATRAEMENWDFVCGIYFQGGIDNYPLIAHFNGKSFNWIIQFPENCIIPIDGCGFGCVVTSLKMLRALDQPCFEYKDFSEDFTFCLGAKKKGFQLYCDTGVMCGHIKEPRVITYEDFKKSHPEFLDGGKVNGTVRSDSAA